MPALTPTLKRDAVVLACSTSARPATWQILAPTGIGAADTGALLAYLGWQETDGAFYAKPALAAMFFRLVVTNPIVAAQFVRQGQAESFVRNAVYGALR